MTQIFSPADPDIFHQRYLASFEFIQKFEDKCAQFNDKDLKQRLQQSQSFKYFVKKWPVQVYFQIRFQEIAIKIEENLLNYKTIQSNDDSLDTEENEINDRNQNLFNLRITKILVEQMEYSWSESGCFLNALLSHFWKLNIQIVSRYCHFFSQLYQLKLSQLEKTNQSIDQFNLQIPDDQEKSSSRPRTPDSNDQNPIELQASQLTDDLELSVLLLLDVHKLQSVKLPNLFDGIISPIVRSVNTIKGTLPDVVVLKEAFGGLLNSLAEIQIVVCDFIVKKEIVESAEFLKNVNDIARLYRRTNREVNSIDF